MPYRDRAQVERWLADFWDAHSLFSHQLSVLDDDFVPHANSGLVVAYLERSPGLAYLSVKIIDGKPRWMVTFEPRQDAINLEAAGVRELTREIAALGTLCDYLQTRTDEATRLTAL